MFLCSSQNGIGLDLRLCPSGEGTSTDASNENHWEKTLGLYLSSLPSHSGMYASVSNPSPHDPLQTVTSMQETVYSSQRKDRSVFLWVICHSSTHTLLQSSPTLPRKYIIRAYHSERVKRQASLLIPCMVGREDQENPPKADVHAYLVQWWWGCWPQSWWRAGVTFHVPGCYLGRIGPFLEVWTLVGRKERKEKNKKRAELGNSESTVYIHSKKKKKVLFIGQKLTLQG